MYKLPSFHSLPAGVMQSSHRHAFKRVRFELFGRSSGASRSTFVLLLSIVNISPPYSIRQTHLSLVFLHPNINRILKYDTPPLTTDDCPRCSRYISATIFYTLTWSKQECLASAFEDIKGYFELYRQSTIHWPDNLCCTKDYDSSKEPPYSAVNSPLNSLIVRPVRLIADIPLASHRLKIRDRRQLNLSSRVDWSIDRKDVSPKCTPRHCIGRKGHSGMYLLIWIIIFRIY